MNIKKYDLPVKYNELQRHEKRLVREQYIDEQDGKCYYCDNDLNGNPIDKVKNARINLKLFPIGFLNHPVHLHHDHNTGLTLGAVHARCNAYLWQYVGE